MCIQHLQVYWELWNLLSVNCICFLKKGRLKKICACQCSYLFREPLNDCYIWAEPYNQKEVIKGKKIKTINYKIKNANVSEAFEKE